MADAVTSQTIQDGEKTAILKFTNVSDGTGESAVKKQMSLRLQKIAQGKLVLLYRQQEYIGQQLE